MLGSLLPRGAAVSRCALVLCLVLLTLPSGRAAAQSDAARDAARAEFQVGLQAAQEGDWERAHEFFERAYELAPLPGVLMNLAGAQRHTGRLVSSVASYRRFLDEVTEGRDARHRPTVESALAEVEGAIPTLVIHVEGMLDGDQARLDGEPLSEFDVPVRVDPGSHHVTIYRDGRALAEEEIEIEEGHSRDVHVSAPPRVPDPAQVAAASGGGEGSSADIAAPGDDTPIIVGVVVGVVLALGIAGAIVGILFATQDSPSAFQGNFGPGSVEVSLR